jgi:16S rRNA (guanine1516-N2)-methyltransferase
MALYVKNGDITLSETRKSFAPQFCDFRGLESRLTPFWNSAPLFLALGFTKNTTAEEVKNIRVLDATAGWGSDSWKVAKAGYQVVAVERDPVMHTMLKQGIKHALRSPKLSITADRLHIFLDDSNRVLQQIADEGENSENRPDFVLVDMLCPKFNWGGSASPSQAMVRHRLMHLLMVPEGLKELQTLLSLACRVARRGVVHSWPRAHPQVFYLIRGNEIIESMCSLEHILLFM